MEGNRNGAAKGPRNAESLRVTLAGVNAKLDELRTENAVLQDAASRSKSLAVEKVALQKVRSCPPLDWESALIVPRRRRTLSRPRTRSQVFTASESTSFPTSEDFKPTSIA